MSSPAVNPYGPDASPPAESIDLDDKQAPDWEKRRERAVWYGVVGIGMMFAGQISTAIAVGGAGMVIFGIFEYIRWGMKRPAHEDPWRDQDIDHWEENEFSKEGGLADEQEHDAPEIIDSNPDEAWGVHNKRF